MADAVLDASALIAFLRQEPGADKVAAVIDRVCISAVTLAEVLGTMADCGKDLEEAAYYIAKLDIPAVPFDTAQARIAASIRRATRDAGIATGGLACLSLAAKLAVPALTTERDWSKCKIGVDVVRIR